MVVFTEFSKSSYKSTALNFKTQERGEMEKYLADGTLGNTFYEARLYNAL